MMMTTSTELEYQQVLNDLQEVNNQLFYDELKEKMAKHLQQLEEEYAKVEGSMENVRFKLERFEDGFFRITEEASRQMRTAVSNIEQEVPNLFEEQLNMIGDIFVAFSDLADEQKMIIKDSEKVWRDMNSTVITSQKEIYKEIISELQRLGVKQEESVKSLFEEISLHYARINKDFLGLTTRLTEEQGRQHQQVSMGLAAVNVLIDGAGESVRLQLKKELSDRDMIWQQQKEELEVVKKQQEENKASNKKWLIGFSIAQTVILAVVVGLYFL